MKLARKRLADALGCVLAENVSAGGRRLLGKGTTLGASEISRLRALGVETAIVAMLERCDVGEQPAALRIATELAAIGRLQMRAAFGGRVCLFARHSGAVELDAEALLTFNRLAGVTLATRRRGDPVQPGDRVGTLKIIPLAIPDRVVGLACEYAARAAPRVLPWRYRRVVLLVTGAPERSRKLLPGYEAALSRRLHRLGTFEFRTHFVGWGSDPERDLQFSLRRETSQRDTLILLAGDTACMDPADVAPRAIEGLGGCIEALGAPVFPGNLLLVATLGQHTVVGLPGCVRSSGSNVIDLVLPRVLSGQKLGQEEVDGWGHGGLLLEPELSSPPRTHASTADAPLEL